MADPITQDKVKDVLKILQSQIGNLVNNPEKPFRYKEKADLATTVNVVTINDATRKNNGTVFNASQPSGTGFTLNQVPAARESGQLKDTFAISKAELQAIVQMERGLFAEKNSQLPSNKELNETVVAQVKKALDKSAAEGIDPRDALKATMEARFAEYKAAGMDQGKSGRVKSDTLTELPASLSAAAPVTNLEKAAKLATGVKLTAPVKAALEESIKRMDPKEAKKIEDTLAKAATAEDAAKALKPVIEGVKPDKKMAVEGFKKSVNQKLPDGEKIALLPDDRTKALAMAALSEPSTKRELTAMDATNPDLVLPAGRTLT